MGHRERQREGSGCHRGQTESCGLHQTAPVELQATPEGKQSGLEYTKGEMEVLGRDQNTLLQLLVCPERPTPVLRAHGKAKTHASSTHGTARTEAQRLGLLACLAPSNVKHGLRIAGVPARLRLAALLRKCECLQIAGRQKGLAWKAVAQPPVLMALLTQKHKDWGCLLVLPPQTSHVAWERGGSLSGSFAAVLRKCKRVQIAGRQIGLAWKAVAQPHLPMALLAQRHRDWGCLLVLPPQTSNVTLAICAGGLHAGLLPKCERLQIAYSQKELA